MSGKSKNESRGLYLVSATGTWVEVICFGLEKGDFQQEMSSYALKGGTRRHQGPSF